ncbi:MAG: 2-oxo acid dehydrogenase subunit E2 [Planctomycetaceae bacterium]
MPIEFKLPEVSEGVESADVAEILVSEGDEIEADQVVMEIETEKAVVELPCPHAGKIAKVHVSEGDTVEIGAVLLTIEESGDGAAKTESKEEKAPTKEEKESAEAKKKSETKAAADDEEQDEEAPAEEKSAKKKAAAKKEGVEESLDDESPAGKQETQAPKKTGPERSQATLATSRAAQADELSDKAPPPATPTTRRLARTLGIDLRRVEGSGPGGRIEKEDVEDYVRDLAGRAEGDGPPSIQAGPLPDFSKFGETERQPLSKLARTSAANLARSWQTIPHVTQHDLADVTEIEAARKSYLERAGDKGPKITMTAIVAKAVISALKEYPQFNASLDAEANELVLKHYYHIGIAVDTEYGLLVPVIRDCDRKSVLEIAGELEDVAEKARNRKLSIEEMQGASFTITNLGGIGGTGFTPIVNHPEVAILGLSRGRKELVMKDGRPEERLMLPISLSYDHRVINGADAARFVVKLARTLSATFQLLIER